jgi:hypothetical protein
MRARSADDRIERAQVDMDGIPRLGCPVLFARVKVSYILVLGVSSRAALTHRAPRERRPVGHEAQVMRAKEMN